MLVTHGHSKYSKAAVISPQGKKKEVPFLIPSTSRLPNEENKSVVLIVLEKIVSKEHN